MYTPRERIDALYTQMSETIVANQELLSVLILSYIAWGHILVQWPPWTAKTLTAKTFAGLVGESFSRIQFTPDLLPSDITWWRLFNQKTWEFEEYLGPISAWVVLADEINRAPATVQSALLQAMAEWTVTIWSTQYTLPDWFFVIGTQNPTSYEWTYPLSQVQTDRFLCMVDLTHLGREDEIGVLTKYWSVGEDPTSRSANQWNRLISYDQLKQIRVEVEQVYTHPTLIEYVASLLDASRTLKPYGLNDRTPYLSWWFSSRAWLGLLRTAKVYARWEWRDYCMPEDITQCAAWVLPHRVSLSYQAVWTDWTPKRFVYELLERVAVPSASYSTPNA